MMAGAFAGRDVQIREAERRRAAKKAKAAAEQAKREEELKKEIALAIDCTYQLLNHKAQAGTTIESSPAADRARYDARDHIIAAAKLRKQSKVECIRVERGNSILIFQDLIKKALKAGPTHLQVIEAIVTGMQPKYKLALLRNYNERKDVQPGSDILGLAKKLPEKHRGTALRLLTCGIKKQALRKLLNPPARHAPAPAKPTTEQRLREQAEAIATLDREHAEAIAALARKQAALEAKREALKKQMAQTLAEQQQLEERQAQAHAADIPKGRRMPTCQNTEHEVTSLDFGGNEFPLFLNTREPKHQPAAATTLQRHCTPQRPRAKSMQPFGVARRKKLQTPASVTAVSVGGAGLSSVFARAKPRPQATRRARSLSSWDFLKARAGRSARSTTVSNLFERRKEVVPGKPADSQGLPTNAAS